MKRMLFILLSFFIHTLFFTFLHYYGLLSYRLSFFMMQIISMFLYFLIGMNIKKATSVAFISILILLSFRIYSLLKFVCLLLGFILQRKDSFI